MKTIYLLPLLTLLLIPTAFAQTDEEDAGITPDHFLYGLDVALDNLLLSLESDPDKKRILGLKIASERLSEIREMVAENKITHAETAKGHHDRVIKNIEDSLASSALAIDPNRNPEERFEASLEAQVRFENHLIRVETLEETIREKIQDDQNRLETRELTVLNRIANTLDDELVRSIISVDSERIDAEKDFRKDQIIRQEFDTDRKIIDLETRLIEITGDRNDVEGGEVKVCPDFQEPVVTFSDKILCKLIVKDSGGSSGSKGGGY